MNAKTMWVQAWLLIGIGASLGLINAFLMPHGNNVLFSVGATLCVSGGLLSLIGWYRSRHPRS